MRKLRLFVLVLLVLGLVASIAGYAYDRVATSRDRQKYPMKGELVDLGGYRIHLYCTGHGSPTVLLDAGALDSLEQWNRVQPEVARFTQVCSYDRPGLGWSDPSPYPQTARQIVTELHNVLSKAGIPGPYLPVGHSMAGLYARVFATQFRDQTTGLVLEDSVHPDEFKQFPSHFPDHPVLFTVLRLAAPLGVARVMHLGCRQTAAHPDCSKFVVTLMKQVSIVKESYAQAGAGGPLGNLPLVVIAHDPKVGLDKVRDDQAEAAWTQWQLDLAHLSSNSTLTVAQGIGHEIQTDKPQMVVEAIRGLVERWRDAGR